MSKPLKTFYSSIDTWRGLAALSVCAYHFSFNQNEQGNLFEETHPLREICSYGYLGVYIFFVISGFVIPLSMHNGQYAYKKWWRFIAKRSVRIEPPYIACIIASIMLSYLLARYWGLEPYFDPLRFLTNITYTVPFVKNQIWYNEIFWTLAIEFQFYLLCALMYPLWTHARSWVRHSSFLLFLFAAWFAADNRFVSFYASIFGFGILLFLFRKNYMGLFEAAIYFILCSFLLYHGNTFEIWLASIISFIIIILPDFKFQPGIILGKVSYSFYLMHSLLGGTFLYFSHKGSSYYSELYFIAAIALAYIGSSIFYWLIEKPFQRLSQKIKL